MSAKIFVLGRDVVYLTSTYLAHRVRSSRNAWVVTSTHPLTRIRDVLYTEFDSGGRVDIKLDNHGASNLELTFNDTINRIQAFYYGLTGIRLLPNEVLSVTNPEACESAVAAFLAERGE